MTIEEAIEYVHDIANFDYDRDECYTRNAIDAAKLSLEALLEKQAREKNDPLTLEELRQMDGQPVWVEDERQLSEWNLVYVLEDNTVVCTDKYGGGIKDDGYDLRDAQDGKLDRFGWIAYRYPKGETE